MADSEQVQTEQTDEQTSDKMQAQTAEFNEAADAGADSGENLNILMDIGKAEVPFKRLLQLGPDSVLELDRLVGQPADLYVQDIRLATGDVVVVNDNYGIRIREVVGSESVRDMNVAEEAVNV